MDLFDKINENGKAAEPASAQSVEELLTMINEMAMSYGSLVDMVSNLQKQNISLRAKVQWLDEHVVFLLAKDPEYVEHAEKVIKESQAKEGDNDQGNSVSAVMPS